MEQAHEYAGREAKHDLNFRKWSESKHAQYFTPMKLAETIAGSLSYFIPLNNLNVLDPTCGSGRLLKPFLDAGSHVLGIELDRDAAQYAKKALGAKNVRVGDICEYRSHLSSNFDVVVTNPPYGIIWHPDSHYHTSRYDGSIESQSATLEICYEALHYNGFLVAIIPTTTFSNEKDKKIKDYLYSYFNFIARITLENLFFEEYNITPKVDLIFAQQGSMTINEERKTVTATLDYRNETVHEKIRELMQEAAQQESHQSYYSFVSEPPSVPDLSLLKITKINPILNLTEHGLVGDVGTMLFAHFLDKIPAYNPVFGKETGAFDAYCSEPALLKRGIDAAEQFLSAVGFEITVSPATRQKLHWLKKKYAKLAIPVYRPQPHQLLAYFDEKPYVAKEAVTDADGVLLFEKDKKYMLRPGWVRNRETVKREIKVVKEKQTTFIHDVDCGYLAFTVATEAGSRTFREIDKAEVELLTQTFGLPEIKDLADHFPETVENNRKCIAREYPFLFDYQREDLARLMLKNGIYLGYEMGGGKTVTGACWASLKGYRRILVVCQPGAVNNWMRELKKFGFAVEKLLSHFAINKLLGAPKTERPTFYITSFQFLSLDTQRSYDPWDCIKHDKDGKPIHTVKGNSNRTCSDCGRSFDTGYKACPKCDGLELWTGNHCHHCGFRPWTYTRETTQYPAYKRIRNHIFDCLLVDEAQEAKNKNSFRGRAVRAIRTKGIALLTGTLMKGYISDVFWNIGKLVGFGNLLFPYPYRGGSKLFLDEFGTYEYVSKQFENTLHEGRARLLPEVSNLNRFWRILASFTVRRLKDSMVELPPKKRHYELVPMQALQADTYHSLESWAQKEIQKALATEEPNMGKISNALWKLRFAATQPTDVDKLGDYAIAVGSWAKLDRIIELVSEIKKRKEQVVIFSSLRSMVKAISDRLTQMGFSNIPVTASTKVERRLDLIDAFQENGHVALVAGTNCANRAFTITSANNVIIANLEFSPEPTVQAEDRVHRTGQTKPVNVHYLFSENTIDQDMWELVTKKGEAIKNAIDMKARDVDVADLLQSKTELEVAVRVLDRKTEESVRVVTNGVSQPVKEQIHLQTIPVRRRKRRKPIPEYIEDLQLDLFFDVA